MMEPASFTAEKALAEALARLEGVEVDNKHLRSKLQQMARDARTVERMEGRVEGREGSRELEKQRKQIKELMHVNSQWDLEYKELDEAFRRYRIDSMQAQENNQSITTKLRETKEKMSVEIRELQAVISRRDREVADLRVKVRALDDEVRSCRLGKPVVSQERVRELEEESHMLRQQLKAYQDDFNSERRDRERMNEEKESAAVRYEAEVTSLRLQLERCRNELAHYTAEANRLSQQLRLKSQIEEEQYKRHLESNGYITRSASGQLPPLDPFVDVDEEMKQPRNPSPRLLTRGVDLVQAYSNSHGAQACLGPQRAGAELLDSERSRSPIKNGTGQGYQGSASPHVQRSVSPLLVPSTATNADHSTSRVSNFRPSMPPSMTNASSNHHHTPQRHNGYSNAPAHSNAGGNTLASSYHIVEPEDVNLARPVYQDAGMGRNNAPPLETKGKYSCPRCERKFESKRTWTDHKSRCMV